MGQIYLLDNPLLRGGLQPELLKPRLLGHWGTTPGLNFIYAHLNRVIKRDDLDMIYVCGPGTAGRRWSPARISRGVTASGTPTCRWTRTGCGGGFRAVLLPRRDPEPRGAGDPGSIHEGGELGYALAHAYGAAFDNPELIVACVVGDGEAETGPLATAWHSNKFLHPVTQRAALPVLHLNGYKISNTL